MQIKDIIRSSPFLRKSDPAAVSDVIDNVFHIVLLRPIDAFFGGDDCEPASNRATWASVYLRAFARDPSNHIGEVGVRINLTTVASFKSRNRPFQPLQCDLSYL